MLKDCKSKPVKSSFTFKKAPKKTLSKLDSPMKQFSFILHLLTWKHPKIETYSCIARLTGQKYEFSAM